MRFEDFVKKLDENGDNEHLMGSKPTEGGDAKKLNIGSGGDKAGSGKLSREEFLKRRAAKRKKDGLGASNPNPNYGVDPSQRVK